MIWIIISLLAACLDQLVKFLVITNIKQENSITIINGFFYITYIKNSGAAWSILQNGRLFFIILTPVIMAVIYYYLYKADNQVLKLSLSLILGGAFGNFIDRLFRGSVIDFLEFHFGSYVFPIFNIADSFVVVGTCLLAIYLLFIHKEKEKTIDLE